MAWVELSPDGHVVRIFRNHKAAVNATNAFPMVEMLRADAVRDIRLQVFKRDDYTCTHCGAAVSWESGHLHERQWRGRGGEMSLDNSTTLCGSCHIDDPVAGHGNRKPQWSKS
jgi:hypothetical protein